LPESREVPRSMDESKNENGSFFDAIDQAIAVNKDLPDELVADFWNEPPPFGEAAQRTHCVQSLPDE